MFQNKLVLASASIARADLLKQIHITPHIIVKTNIDETIQKKEKPFALCKRLSLTKVLMVKNNYQDSFILGADTVVVRGNKIIGKPKDKDEARYFMEILSGHKHKVITGVTLYSPQDKIITKVATTTVAFKNLSKEEINTFLNTNEWENKAGGYGAQGYAEVFIKQIIGSYSNIVGLPLSVVYNMLKGLGYNFNKG